MKRLLERLKEGEILLADGAMGTMLLFRGLLPGQPPEAFNLSHPEIVAEIARLYLEAGAEIISTNTFGASPLKLAFYHLADKMAEINRNAVLAVRKVALRRAYISASIGPSGRLLKPYGDTTPAVIYENYLQQMKVLVDVGVDLFCIETMTDLNEAVLAIKAAKAIAPSIPVIATMTFDQPKRGFYTIMGNSLPQAVVALSEAGADIIGSNCGNGIRPFIEIAREMREVTDLPLIIQPNAGLPRIFNGKTLYPETPEFMAEKVKELLKKGVSIIGGCCGTTPEHIRAFRRIVDHWANTRK